jgi:peroxiredoxin
MNKKWIYALGLIIAAVTVVYLYKHYRVAPAINFNQLSLVDLDGQPVNFESFNGKKTVVCFSASWCGNCVEELRDINAVKAEHLADIEILVISDESVEKIISFKNKTAYPFTFLKMNQSFSTVGIHSIPTSYVLNTKQKIMKETVGYLNWKDASTREHLKKLME